MEEEDDVYVMSHEDKYHYKFFDAYYSHDSLNLDKYNTSYSISNLRVRKEKLIHIDTVFGSSRIAYSDEKIIKWVRDMNKSLKIHHLILLDVANNIINELGGSGNFVGVHVRVGDGFFHKNSDRKSVV